MTRTRIDAVVGAACPRLWRREAFAGRAQPPQTPHRGVNPAANNPASRQCRSRFERHGALPHALRRLSRPRCHRLSRARPRRALAGGGRRPTNGCSNDPQGRARHRDAAERRRPGRRLLMIIAYLRKLGTVAPAGAAGRQRRERRAAVRARSARAVIASPARGGRLGPDLTRIGVARSRAALIREIRTPSEWVPPAFETVTRRHQGRPAHPRRQEERRRLLDSGHGHARADPGLSEVEPAGSDLREGLADAGVRAGPAERQRSERSGRLPEHAARRGCVGSLRRALCALC